MFPRRSPLAPRTLLLALALSSSLAAQAPSIQPAPDPSAAALVQAALNQGIQAFKDARYAAAAAHFKAALALDPASTQARQYLGNTYAYQVVPNLDTPENLAVAKLALETLKQIPEAAPEYLNALRQIGAVYRNTEQTEPAKETELHILKLDPSDPEAHYTIGVLDWQGSYRNAREVLARNGLTDDGNGNATLTRSACLDLRSRNAPVVADGLDHLTRAVDLKPTYDDAMQYLNLTYRRQADLACGDAIKRIEDLAAADEWTRKAMETRKLNELPSPPATR